MSHRRQDLSDERISDHPTVDGQLHLPTRDALRVCPLCEAGCGLRVTVDRTEQRVVRIRGDQDHVASHGFLCPKGTALGALQDDPDRLRRPLVRHRGRLVEATFEEAIDECAARLQPIIEHRGPDAVGVYLGNPCAHNLDAQIYLRPLLAALGSRHVFSAATLDQRPKEISAALMFGAMHSIPVPDIDRTDHLVIVGANPFVSNGSLASAPDWPGRIKAIRSRSGTVVVVDPRRTKTAENADTWVPIRPGSDAYLLLGMIHVLFAEGAVDLGGNTGWTSGVDEVGAAVQPFTPEVVESATAIDAATTRRLALGLATAERACIYARIGTSNARHGTVASWAVDVLNALTGNLDRPGGAMFALPATGSANTRGEPRTGRPIRLHRYQSRVRGLGETFGELPVAGLADEILTPGDGQVRALITVAGNPALTGPTSRRVHHALRALDSYIAVDMYLNETTEHADVILPVPAPLQRSHYDITLSQVALRNTATFSEPVLPLAGAERHEWEILLALTDIVSGGSGRAGPALDDDLLEASIRAEVARPHSPVHGRDPEVLRVALGSVPGPERHLDLMLRTGPRGDGFDAVPGGLSLEGLRAAPHGLDLGALEPRLPDALRTPTGTVQLAPPEIVAAVGLVADALSATRPSGIVLIGRRELKSNNSWMHNLPVLLKGRDRCTLVLHPDDAATHGIEPGAEVEVTSRTGSIIAIAEIDEGILPGVVSLPHGWGHTGPGLSIARTRPGVNVNVLTDDHDLDPLSGNPAFSGVPVSLRAMPAADG